MSNESSLHQIIKTKEQAQRFMALLKLAEGEEIMEKKKLVVLTGAGISAESGIQTFRDSDGLWNGFDVMEVASIEGWAKDRKKMLDFYNMRRKDAIEAKPNAAHIGLAELQEFFDVTIITQNVDNLHEQAGSKKVIHLHGELSKMCSSLNKTKTLPYDKDINIGDKHEDGSQLRPFIVWFGEDVPMLTTAEGYTYDADVFVVVGTSLQVYPAANLIFRVRAGVPRFIVDKSIPELPLKMNNLTKIEMPATEGVAQLKEYLFGLFEIDKK